ncbi:MAG: tetratricopeptide repeat protein [Planctomycetota bacterium]
MVFSLEGYRIRGEIARGGMGAVYDALDPLGRRVAIKVMLGEGLADPELVARFALEARALEALDHPGILRVLAHGFTAGQPYMVLDFLEGPTLAEEVAARGPLPEPEACEIARRVAAALAHAHARGVVHRDLKPENVILRGPRDPVLVDFGLVRMPWQERKRLTSSGTILGSPSYMSPEQAMGLLQVGHAADLYGLGATLYFLVTGAPPFHGLGVLQVLERVIREEPTPPRTRRPELSAEVEAVILRLLRKAPAERYAAAIDVEDALHGIGEPRPRRSALPLVLAAVLTLLALGLGATLTLRGEDPADAYVERARALVAEGDILAAEEALTAALALNPDHLAALAGRGAARAGRGDLQGGLTDLNRLVALDPDNLRARRNRAWALTRAGDYDAAAVDLAHGLEVSPDDANLLAVRSAWQLARGQVDAAAADAQRAAALAPDDPDVLRAVCDVYLELEDFEAAFAARTRLIELTGTPQSYLARAVLAAKLERTVEAAADVARALELNPTSKEAWQLQGELLLDLGDHQAALDAAARLNELAPELGLGDLLAGDVHVKRGELERAHAAYSRGLRADPRHRAARYNRALIACSLRDFDAALADLDRILAASPDDVAARSLRGDALMNLGRSHDALEEYDRALRLDPTLPQAHVGRGEALASQDRYGEALAALSRGIELEERAEFLAKRARLQLALGRPEDALRDCERALQLEPTSAAALDGRARAHLAQDDLSAGRRDAERALALSPEHYAARTTLAEALTRLGQPQAALAAAERVPTTSPAYDSAQLERARALLELGRGSEALSCAEAVFARYEGAMRPTHEALLGRILFSLERHDEALTHFERALATNPGHSTALLYSGLTKARLGRTDAAIAVLSDYLRAYPASGVARAYRARSLAQLERWDEALADLDACLERDPSYRLGRIFRCVVRSQAGLHAGALEDFEAAARLGAADEPDLRPLWAEALAAKAASERALAAE